MMKFTNLITLFLVFFQSALFAQQITVLSPNGGEHYMKNVYAPHNIRWEATGVANVKLLFSPDNGNNWTVISETEPAAGGAYSWTTPDTESETCLIKIVDATNEAIADESDQVFFITAQQLFVVQWVTSLGSFNVQLRGDLVPTTAQNFLNLAERNFYDNLIFHRVIAGFMIQDGCPLGNGMGDPGYEFADEFHPDLRHSEAGILSMANAGPNTNGSQYFITVNETAWLDDHHAVFGKVLDGLDVVFAISEVETDANDAPIVPVNIQTINLVSGERQLELLIPVGGETFLSGGYQNISWDSQFLADVKIEVSPDNGSTWEIVTDRTSANTRQYRWHVPSVVADSYKIRISDPENPALVSESAAPFKIGLLNVIQPNGSLVKVISGKDYEVLWESENIENINIEYSPDNMETWEVIAENVSAAAGTYTWAVPANLSSNRAFVRFVVSDYPESVVITKRFTICILDFIYPATGTIWEALSTHDISWNIEYIDKTSISYSTDGGQIWAVIATNLTDTTFSWTVPNIPSENCFIRIQKDNDASLFNVSPQFTISPAVGIENIESPEFNIFPNPASEFFFLNLDENISQSSNYQIVDCTGRTVRRGTIEAGKRQIEISVSGISNGVYFFRLESSQNIFQQKLIISR